ncbi:MAG: flavodoxin family protein [Candidatus Hermodarchaeota archaeon]|nr:flavodoxin family protein [Candidatus Hermodarchaeota archaeon]
MAKPTQVIGIVGSPRRNGNTEVLVDEILAGAKEAGASVSKYVLDELDVRPCKGCFACEKTNRCVQEDDMVELVTQMKASQVWVLGTPIYWWGPSAQFKAFIDRWVSIGREHIRGKRVILTMPMGGGSESYARHTLGMLEDVLDYLNMEHLATILAPGFGSRGAVKNAREILSKAHKAGKDSVS